MSALRIAVVLSLIFVPAARAEESADFAVRLGNQYRIAANIVYSTANGYDNKLDVYLTRNTDTPRPTLIYIHGGGWTGGTKESAALRVMPYLALGMNVVNVEYRLARISLAPAAVADCRCALRWVIANAERYGIDPSKLVVTGHSAGGHLSLTTGMLPRSAGLDFECSAGNPNLDLKVAAIVNWYGITDVGDLLEGMNQKSYAVRWLGSLANRYEVAKRVSPLEYVRAGLPPTLTIHGDADPTVPYEHAVRLHEALEAKGVPNQLYTVAGGKHGGFTLDEELKIGREIESFLRKHGVL